MVSVSVRMTLSRATLSEITPFSQSQQYLLCNLNSCSYPAPPAAQHSVTQSSYSKQTDGHYIQCFCNKKKYNFHESQGCCSSPEAHEKCDVKNSKTWTSTSPPTVFVATRPPQPLTSTHQASSGPLVIMQRVKAIVYWTASWPQLFIWCIGALFAGVSAQATEFLSAQRKEKCQLANLEKESCLYEDTFSIPQHKWDRSSLSIGDSGDRG